MHELYGCCERTGTKAQSRLPGYSCRPAALGLKPSTRPDQSAGAPHGGAFTQTRRGRARGAPYGPGAARSLRKMREARKMRPGSRRRTHPSRRGILAGLLPECRDACDAKHVANCQHGRSSERGLRNDPHAGESGYPLITGLRRIIETAAHRTRSRVMPYSFADAAADHRLEVEIAGFI